LYLLVSPLCDTGLILVYRVLQKNYTVWIWIIRCDISIYEDGSLFVLFCTTRSTELGCFRSHSSVSLESSWGGGVHGLGFTAFGPAVQKFLNIEWFLHWKVKLNGSWKFQRNWNVPLVSLERYWWAGFNGIYLVRFGFGMWEILILKSFLLKIEINSQKTRFWKEKSVEDVVTLGPTAQATLVWYDIYNWRIWNGYALGINIYVMNCDINRYMYSL